MVCKHVCVWFYTIFRMALIHVCINTFFMIGQKDSPRICICSFAKKLPFVQKKCLPFARRYAQSGWEGWNEKKISRIMTNLFGFLVVPALIWGYSWGVEAQVLSMTLESLQPKNLTRWIFCFARDFSKQSSWKLKGLVIRSDLTSGGSKTWARKETLRKIRALLTL